MRTVEIIGYKRANLGKTDAKQLRSESHVPCVLYGGKDQIHFYSPMILFRDIVYTPEPAFVTINIEGDIHTGILQDAQFHPVNEMILHADFLELTEGKPIKMDIPIILSGKSPGVVQGGRLNVKLRSVKIKALPKNMPEVIDLDISGLSLGKSLKVSDIVRENFEILNNDRITIATVQIPRTVLAEEEEEEEDEVEGAEGGESAPSETSAE